jgi:Bacterial aa3 type cytochrome c oxidase subunit IV
MKTREKWDWRRHPMSVDMSDGHPAMDYKQHEATYRGFLRGVQYTVIAVALLLIIMAATLV